MKTKLTTLNPRWMLGNQSATPDGVKHSCDRGNLQERYGMGISFDCPVHGLKFPLHIRHRVKIFFANPLDGLPPEHGVPLWHRGGGTFKALTVSPAGDAVPECWHGLIRNGEIP